jgi:hypothetical protein
VRRPRQIRRGAPFTRQRSRTDRCRRSRAAGPGRRQTGPTGLTPAGSPTLRGPRLSFPPSAYPPNRPPARPPPPPSSADGRLAPARPWRPGRPWRPARPCRPASPGGPRAARTPWGGRRCDYASSRMTSREPP